MQHKCNKCTYKATHNPNHRNLVNSVQGTHITSITNVYKVEHKYDMKTQILYINKDYTTTVINLKLSQYINFWNSFLDPQDVPFFKAAKFTGLGMSLSFTNRQWDLVIKKLKNSIF